MPVTHRIGLVRLAPPVSSFCSAKIVPRFRAVEPHPLQPRSSRVHFVAVIGLTVPQMLHVNSLGMDYAHR